MADEYQETFKPGEEKDIVKAVEDYLNQPGELRDLKEWALIESQNLTSEADINDLVKRCQNERISTFQATVEQIGKESEMFEKLYEGFDDEEKRNVIEGFASVAGRARYLSKIQTKTAEKLDSERTRSVETLGQLMGIEVGDEKWQRHTGYIDWYSGFKELERGYEEFATSIMAQNPSGFSALDSLVQEYKERLRGNGGPIKLKEIKDKEVKSFFVDYFQKLIGVEIGVARFKEIFNQIEQSSWESENPYTSKK